MKITKKGLVISLCIFVALVGIAVIAFVSSGKMTKKSSDDYTVKFELCTDIKTTTVLERKVAPGLFLDEPEVYVTEDNEDNWKISGWYKEAEYTTQWDFDFDTVESDLTLYAKWESTPQCAVSFYTVESTGPVYTTKVKKGLVATQCNEEFKGREVLGYYSDKEMTQVFDFEKAIEEDTSIYINISEYVYFDAKAIYKWNICGNQSEITNYEVSTELSGNEDSIIFTSKNGGYIWLADLALNMNGTNLIEIKMKELNDDYAGNLGGYILGSYTINGEAGANDNFGQPNTGDLIYERSAEPDEDGYYTYSYSIGNLTPGLQYTELKGIRIDIYGLEKYSYEIKEIRTSIATNDVSGEDVLANKIDLNSLDLNTFLLMGGATTNVLDNGDFQLSGVNGAFIYKKDLSINLGEEQVIQLKAKGDLKGGAVGLYLFGDYTVDGVAESTTDYGAHCWVMDTGETDADGYTIYTVNISTIQGLEYQTIKGLRLELWGSADMTLDITK